jgi:hypothetical protein
MFGKRHKELETIIPQETGKLSPVVVTGNPPKTFISGLL